MITFHHNFFPSVSFAHYLKKDGDDSFKLSDSYIQILLSQALIDYIEAASLTKKYSLEDIIIAIRLYFKWHLAGCCKEIILYREYTPETVTIGNGDIAGNSISVYKGLHDMWLEKRANHAGLDGKVIDKDKGLTVEELFDRKSFCLYNNQDVYDNCFVHIDILYLLKLIGIE